MGEHRGRFKRLDGDGRRYAIVELLVVPAGGSSSGGLPWWDLATLVLPAALVVGLLALVDSRSMVLSVPLALGAVWALRSRLAPARSRTVERSTSVQVRHQLLVVDGSEVLPIATATQVKMGRWQVPLVAARPVLDAMEAVDTEPPWELWDAAGSVDGLVLTHDGVTVTLGGRGVEVDGEWVRWDAIHEVSVLRNQVMIRHRDGVAMLPETGTEAAISLCLGLRSAVRERAATDGSESVPASLAALVGVAHG